jgi:hypothetical protein
LGIGRAAVVEQAETQLRVVVPIEEEEESILPPPKTFTIPPETPCILKNFTAAQLFNITKQHSNVDVVKDM